MFHTSDGRKIQENLDEFDDARQVVAALSAEYEACEHSDYVRSATDTWVLNLSPVPLPGLWSDPCCQHKAYKHSDCLRPRSPHFPNPRPEVIAWIMI